MRWNRRHQGLVALGVSIVLAMTCTACANKNFTMAQAAYVAGSYDQAVDYCATSLREEPDSEEAQKLIQDAFRAAVDKHESKIKELSLSTDKFKWDGLVPEYTALVKLNNTVGPVAASIPNVHFEIKDYTADAVTVKTNAAEAHYQEGDRLSRSGAYMEAARQFQTCLSFVPGYKDAQNRYAEAHYQEGDRLFRSKAYKEAARQFQTCLSIVPGYKDAQKRYEESRIVATRVIAVIPFEDKSGKAGRYGALSEMVVDDIVKKVMEDPRATEFLEIVSRDKLEIVMKELKLGLSGAIDDKTAAKVGYGLGAKDIVTGKITGIVYSSPPTTSKTEHKKKGIPREQEFKNAKGETHSKKWTEFVNATVTVYEKKASARVVGSYQIIEVETTKVKKADSLPGEAAFESKWAACAGDERAFDERLCGKNEEVAPGEEEMVRQAFTKMSERLAESFKTYARQ